MHVRAWVVVIAIGLALGGVGVGVALAQSDSEPAVFVASQPEELAQSQDSGEPGDTDQPSRPGPSDVIACFEAEGAGVPDDFSDLDFEELTRSLTEAMGRCHEELGELFGPLAELPLELPRLDDLGTLGDFGGFGGFGDLGDVESFDELFAGATDFACELFGSFGDVDHLDNSPFGAPVHDDLRARVRERLEASGLDLSASDLDQVDEILAEELGRVPDLPGFLDCEPTD